MRDMDYWVIANISRTLLNAGELEVFMSHALQNPETLSPRPQNKGNRSVEDLLSQTLVYSLIKRKISKSTSSLQSCESQSEFQNKINNESHSSGDLSLRSDYRTRLLYPPSSPLKDAETTGPRPK